MPSGKYPVTALAINAASRLLRLPTCSGLVSRDPVVEDDLPSRGENEIMGRTRQVDSIYPFVIPLRRGGKCAICGRSASIQRVDATPNKIMSHWKLSGSPG